MEQFDVIKELSFDEIKDIVNKCQFDIDYLFTNGRVDDYYIYDKNNLQTFDNILKYINESCTGLHLKNKDDILNFIVKYDKSNSEGYDKFAIYELEKIYYLILLIKNFNGIINKCMSEYFRNTEIDDKYQITYSTLFDIKYESIQSDNSYILNIKNKGLKYTLYIDERILDVFRKSYGERIGKKSKIDIIFMYLLNAPYCAYIKWKY